MKKVITAILGILLMLMSAYSWDDLNLSGLKNGGHKETNKPKYFDYQIQTDSSSTFNQYLNESMAQTAQ